MPFLLAAVLVLPTPESRALAYLAREVPAWSTTNKCYSCHNNGNAARALYTATRLGYTVPDQVLADTTRWLAVPAGWDKNGGDQAFNDKDLAHLQFTLALQDATSAGQVDDRRPLLAAAATIAARQLRDGSWSVGSDATVGSPTTYGSKLATAESRRLLARVNPERFAASIRRADDWLGRQPVRSVLDAAATLLAPGSTTGDMSLSRRGECLAILRKGEAKGGGWGPFVNAAPEAFDTALVVIALSREPQTVEVHDWLRRGRAFLVRTQRVDGSWPETTRPAGAESYAERLSTAGWATRALLATR
jgi:hypothetical protein